MRYAFLFTGLVLFTALALLLTGSSGCANIVPPQGGPRDTIPPVLLKAIPGDSSVNFSGNKIVFTFDEFVDVQDVYNNLLVSPLGKTTPTVESRLREITVKLKDSLEPNTTYALDFGKAIKDINEGNIMKNFRYTFSTGPYIDSLELKGTVVLAENAKTDSTLIVMLHTSADDSAVAKEKPKYVARLDGKGRFHFKNLPPRTFYLYALKDEGGMRRYSDEKQLFAFLDSAVIPSVGKDTLTLYAWSKKEPVLPLVSAGETGPRNRPAANAADKRLKFQTSLNNNQQDLKTDLVLSFESPLKNFDSSGIGLFTDTSFTPVAFKVEKDSTHLQIVLKSAWQEGTLYQLVLNRDFAEDSSGRKLLKTDTLSFSSKKKADYGNLKIRFRNLDTASHPVLLLLQADKIIATYPLTAAEFSQSMLNPGEYDMRLFFDENKNGVWDPGSYFKGKKQPEKVKPLNRKLALKPNWTSEYDIDLNL